MGKEEFSTRAILYNTFEVVKRHIGERTPGAKKSLEVLIGALALAYPEAKDTIFANLLTWPVQEANGSIVSCETRVNQRYDEIRMKRLGLIGLTFIKGETRDTTEQLDIFYSIDANARQVPINAIYRPKSRFDTEVDVMENPEIAVNFLRELGITEQ